MQSNAIWIQSLEWHTMVEDDDWVDQPDGLKLRLRCDKSETEKSIISISWNQNCISFEKKRKEYSKDIYEFLNVLSVTCILNTSAGILRHT